MSAVGAASQSFGGGQSQPQQQQPASAASVPAPLSLPWLAHGASSLAGPPLSAHSVALLQLLRFWASANAELMAACRGPHCADLTAQRAATQARQLERIALFAWRAIAGGDSFAQPSRRQMAHSLSACLRLNADAGDGDGGGDGSDSASLRALEWWQSAMLAINSPDCVDELFTAELPKLLIHFAEAREQADDDSGVLPAVDANSSFGLFVRHQQLLHRCASFDDVGRLYEQIVDYVAGREDRPATPSASQMLAFVHSKAAAVQSSIGRRSHSAMRRLCDEVAAAASETAPAAASFLCYVTALASSDYEEAARQLHRFADVSSSLDSTAGGSAAGSGRMRSGLLNLALLHARFGHTDVCVELLDECMRLCQSSQDTRTLQHALSILTSLTRDQPATSAATSLFQRCVDAQLVSADRAVQAVEQWKAEQGVGAPPQLQQLEAVHAQTLLLSAQAELWRPLSSSAAASASSTPISPPAVWSTLASCASLSAAYDLQHCLSVERQLRSQAWQLFGSRHLASLWAEIDYRTTAVASTADDALSTLHSLAADPQHSATERDALLAFARLEFPHLSHSPLVDLAYFVRFRLALQRSDLASASLYADAIAQLTAAVSDTAPFAFEQQSEARIAALQLHWQLGRRRIAWLECRDLIARCKERRHVGLTIRLLLVRAEMCLRAEQLDDAASTAAAVSRSAVECESGEKELSDCCRALPVLMEASALCGSAAADVQAAAVSALLARCYVALGRAADGLKAIRRALPATLEHGGVQQLVDALHTLALCYLAVEVEAEAEDDGADCLREAAAVLRVALDAARSLQWRRRCAELSYLYSRVCHEMGWVEERESAAQHFLNYSQHSHHPLDPAHQLSTASVAT